MLNHHTESFICWEKVYPWLYAAGILLGELLVIKNVRTGEIVHLLLLGALLFHAAFYTAGEDLSACNLPAQAGAQAGAGFRTDAAKFYLALALAPLIRILNLSLPLAVFPLTYWYAVVSFPLLVGAVVVAQINGYRRKEIGLGWGNKNLLFHLLFGLTGLPLGLIEYLILRPEPLVPVLSLPDVFLPALILLVCTGFTEEFIFRGIMQKAASDLLGQKTALILVGFIFAILHVTHLSVIDVVFVFGVAVFFSTVVRRTGSLIGVTLAHGLTNIALYLILPFYF